MSVSRSPAPPSPLEKLRPELLPNIAVYLDQPDLKSLRLAVPHLSHEIGRQIFNAIRLEPSTRSANRLLAIVKSPFKNAVQNIVFDINGVFRYRHSRADIATASWTTILPFEDGQTFLHFGMLEFLKSFSLLPSVKDITVTSSGWAGRTRPYEDDTVTEAVLLYQILDLVSRLKHKPCKMNLLAEVSRTLSFDIFDLNASDRLFPIYERIFRPTSPADMANEQVQSHLPAFRGIKNLELQLYHGEGQRRTAALANLKKALFIMAPELESLTMSLLSEGSGSGPCRDRCMDHNTANWNFIESCNFQNSLASITFGALRTLCLENMTYRCQELGEFLYRHQHILERVSVKQWRCLVDLPNIADARTLSRTAGSALNVLTFSSRTSSRGGGWGTGGCEEQMNYAFDQENQFLMWRWYFDLPVSLLVRWLVDEGMSELAVLHSVSLLCHEEEPWGSSHDMALREHEVLMHLAHLGKLEPQEIANRGRWTEQLLQQYCTATSKATPCRHTLRDAHRGQPCGGDGLTFALMVNGQLGLYRFCRRSSFSGPVVDGGWDEACEQPKISIKKWDFAIEAPMRFWPGDVQFASGRSWTDTPETNHLNDLIDAAYAEYLVTPNSARVDRHALICSEKHRAQGLDDMSNGAKNSADWGTSIFKLPELGKIRRTFYFEVEDVPGKRAQMLRAAQDKHDWEVKGSDEAREQQEEDQRQEEEY